MNRDSEPEADKDLARQRQGTTMSPEPEEPAPPLWLLTHRAIVPDRFSGFYRREALARRSTLVARRLTLLIAPAGFGKTTLLAESCRDALERGVPVAWLTLDGRDEPGMLDAYLAYAFKLAGIELLAPLQSDEADIALPFPLTTIILRAVEAHGSPVVLALDEAERLTDPSLVAHLNFLVRGAPPNLHVALAARELPAGFDVSSPVFGREAEILTTEDLRFTQEDVAGFFENKLSRRDLVRVQSMSAGWPIALRIHQNEKPADLTGSEKVVRDVVENWVESRLWRSFSEQERELVLDAGLFDWVNAELLDEALGTRDALRRLRQIRSLDGLLLPVRRTGSEVWQLHSLIRDHCEGWRRRNTNERYQMVHRRAARALSRRHRTLEAMRHAAQVDDMDLLATVVLDAGGVRLMLRESMDRVVAADRLLSFEAISRHPRLAMVRCVALAVTGRLAEARRMLASAPHRFPETQSADDLDLFLDACLAQALVFFVGCESALTEETESMIEGVRSLMDTPSIDPEIRWAWEFSRCVQLGLQASFDEAMDHGHRLRRLLGSGREGLTAAVDTQFGLIAMAQGRVEEAFSWYRRCERIARERFLERPQLALVASVLRRELDIERNRMEVAGVARDLPKEMPWGANLAARFAAADIALEIAQQTQGDNDALDLLDDLWAHAVQAGYPALERHLAARRVSLLVDAGRSDDAQRAWIADALPNTDAACVDLTRQSWREAESVSCARLSLCIALGELDAGRRLGQTMLEVAAERALKRTAMRVRVLCLKLEERSGDDLGAVAHLVAFLEMFSATNYARSLVREGAVAATVIEKFLQMQPASPLRTDAEELLTHIKTASSAVSPRFSEGELEVLRLLETERDDDIAAAVGITRHGVRYRVGSIFRKLGVGNRRQAVRRARAMGVLPPVR